MLALWGCEHMNPRDVTALGKEAFALLCVGACFALALRLMFRADSVLGIARLVGSLLWLFVLPGFALLLVWHKRLDFLERVVVGTAVSTAIYGIVSYYVGLLGLPVWYHPWILPPLMIAAGVFAWLRSAS
jgi:uncharacterized membrane protein